MREFWWNEGGWARLCACVHVLLSRLLGGCWPAHETQGSGILVTGKDGVEEKKSSRYSTLLSYRVLSYNFSSLLELEPLPLVSFCVCVCCSAVWMDGRRRGVMCTHAKNKQEGCTERGEKQKREAPNENERGERIGRRGGRGSASQRCLSNPSGFCLAAPCVYRVFCSTRRSLVFRRCKFFFSP